MIKSADRRGTDSIKWGRYPEDVLPLWVADMDFEAPPSVLRALQERVEHGVFGYPLLSRELQEIIVDRMQRRYGWGLSSDDVILLPGVVAGFNMVCQAVAQPGESILIQPPVYPPFFLAPVNAGAKVVTAEVLPGINGQYEIDFENFEAAIQADTRCFILCNPHNPVGRVYTRNELEKMAEICLRHEVIICADEIHSDLIYPGYRHIPISSLSGEVSDSTITLIAPSKTFNIAGLECSALICTNPVLRERILNARRGLLFGVNIFGQIAAEAAYKGGEDWLCEVLNILEANRDYLIGYLKEHIPQIVMPNPEATYLAWLDCNALDLPVSPYQYFLETAKVALNEGIEFGKQGKGFVRLNFGCRRETLVEALERIRQSLQ